MLVSQADTQSEAAAILNLQLVRESDFHVGAKGGGLYIARVPGDSPKTQPTNLKGHEQVAAILSSHQKITTCYVIYYSFQNW